MSEQQVEEKKKVGRPKKTYKCNICGEEFSTKAGLLSHMGSKHVNKEKPEKLEIEKTEPPKPKVEEKPKKSFNVNIILYILIIAVAGILFYFFVLRRRGDNNEF